MTYIELSGKNGLGKRTLVDDSTLKQYGHLTWHLSDTGYAVRRNKSEGGTVRLHRLVADAPEGMVVDHLNGDKLDNRASNLRVCTQAENTRNRKDTVGICFDKSRSKWIVSYRKQFYGRYGTEQEAKRAYQLAKSGVPYNKTRRKLYMLPKHISRQFGKYVVSVQINGVRYRKVSIPTLEQAISIRDNILEKRG
jgi:hypothetical protein